MAESIAGACTRGRLPAGQATRFCLHRIQESVHVDDGLGGRVLGLALQVAGDDALGDGLDQRLFEVLEWSARAWLSSRWARVSQGVGHTA